MIPRLPARRRAAAFTLLELMVAMTMTAIVLVATLSGVISLQKSYASTEEYANGLADQMRLLDYLAQDLRRAVAVPANGTTAAQPAWVMDTDDQGVTINVPNYYRFNASDPQHLFPVPNDPVFAPTTGVVTYQDPSNPAVTTQQVYYHFVGGSITRTDPWQALVYSSKTGGYVSTGAVTVASNMDAFPTITADPSQTDGSVVHYNVTFHSIFQNLAVAGNTNAITLHNVTFIRSNNLAH